MSVEIRVPSLGESVTEATVARWFKQIGDQVAADEPLVELETDKVTLEAPAPASGVLSEILADEGAEVEVGTLIGSIDPDGTATVGRTPDAAGAAGVAAGDGSTAPAEASSDGPLAPAVRKLLDEHGLDAAGIPATGPKGNLTKGDVLAAIETMDKAPAGTTAPSSAAAAPADASPAPPTTEAPRQERPSSAAAPSPAVPVTAPQLGHGREERVKMTRLRRRIAERLKEAQNSAAILTTYNEADMRAVMALRKRYRESFEARHGVRLGFMSFFVKAAINALQAFPAVNAEIDGEEIVYKHHYDIGVAVGTPSGLVVPVVRDADQRGFAELEKEITSLGLRARDGKLAMEDLMGGTFTISNGGVYGSLMSSPILNPPQVGILGMHKIQDRPMVEAGEIVIRPMMYLALSYDHRIVDGREAVGFLVRVKECIEDPERLMLDV
jgi:2-oxoglutarate dehydrogenase E2 component (dihydrolipoamide succinyltransferase)